jgi:translation elongation factor EF-Tu-like GTPase
MTPYKIAYNFTATLSLFPTENGGRKKPVYEHYRPSFVFSTQQHFSGEISFPGRQELQPGETANALIKLLPSRHIRQNLKSGDSFTILEGDKIVGTGVIQQIEKENKIAVSQ